MDQPFETEQSRQSYLEEKFDNLLDVINNSYGKALLDELVVRMEKTIVDFNEEILTLMDQLKANTDRKSQLLQKLKEHSEMKTMQPDTESEGQSEELSPWERRLESLGKNN